MDVRTALPGLRELQADTLGDPAICIAVLDGPVDLTHPCFAGADVARLDSLVHEQAGRGRMSAHGTHVASLLFGQPGSPVTGIAPRCRGVLIPIFRDDREAPVPQLDLARAIERAVQAGADVVSVSGGERSPSGAADGILENALRACEENDVLVVAAVGNDGCACLQVPAAVPTVLAVGAAGADGHPLRSSNWGEPYLHTGVLAPGQAIDGAAPGGGIAALSGTSFATPLVAGVAALLMSAGAAATGAPARRPVAAQVRRAIVESASPCRPPSAAECRPYLAGTVNVSGAHRAIRNGGTKAVTNPEEAWVTPEAVRPHAEPAPAGVHAAAENAEVPAPPAAQQAPTPPPADVPPPPLPARPAPPPAVTGAPGPTAPHTGGPGPTGGVVAAGDCGCGGESAPGFAPFVYAIGKIGYDFGTEARRDSFRQQMPHADTPPIVDETQSPPTSTFSQAPPNPYDPHQLSRYLSRNPWASNKVIWTLNLERTPIYALEAEVPYGMELGRPSLRDQAATGGAYPPVSPVYQAFLDAIVGHALDPDTDEEYISLVSIPGVLTNRTVRLYSGQVVPIVSVFPRGLYTWNEPQLVDAAISAVQDDADRQRRAGRAAPTVDDLTVRQNIRAFLDKVYFQFRNLGQKPDERALNYAATNAFLLADTLREGFASGTYVPGNNIGLYSLDTIGVTKSPYCRPGSDCWDVSLTFFDPENERRARVNYLFTIDVSDEIPVSLAPSHKFLVGTPQLGRI